MCLFEWLTPRLPREIPRRLDWARALHRRLNSACPGGADFRRHCRPSGEDDRSSAVLPNGSACHYSRRMARASSLLPAELLVVCALAPVGILPILVKDVSLLSGRTLTRESLALYVPFILLSGTFHFVYKYCVPPLLERFRTRLGRGVLHVTVIAAVASGLSFFIRPLLDDARGARTPVVGFTLTCVILSFCLILPALVLQRLRLDREHLKELARAERENALEAQLQALQARTSPHFLFNTLNTVASLIPQRPAIAEEMIERLAEVLRYSLEERRSPTVPLAEELEVTAAYLRLQTLRFGERLQTQMEIDPAAISIAVPRWLLQPLVENALLHGFEGLERGMLTVAARRTAQAVVVEVSDEGPGPGGSTRQGTQTSFRELRQRLQLVCGERALLELLPGPVRGCIARVTVPTESGT